MKKKEKEIKEQKNKAEANEEFRSEGNAESKELTDEADSGQSRQTVPNRSMIIWAVGGIYLLYTGRSLCKGVLDGAEDTGWGFFAVGVIFLILGAGLIFLSLKSYSAKAKADKEKQETAEGESALKAAPERGTEKFPSGASGHRMTIAERARLTSRLGDENEQPEENEQPDTGENTVQEDTEN